MRGNLDPRKIAEKRLSPTFSLHVSGMLRLSYEDE